MRNIKKPCFIMLSSAMWLVSGWCQAQIDIDQLLEKRTNSRTVLQALEPVRDCFQSGSAVFQSGADILAYGLVMGSDGYIMTKASNIGETANGLYVRIGTERYGNPVRIAVDEANDLALYQVDAKQLHVLEANEDFPELGTVIASNSTTTRQARRIRIGITSAMPRSVAAEKDEAYLGFYLNKGMIVERVNDGSPADRAGIRKGDVLVMVDFIPVRSLKAAGIALAGRKPGKPVLFTLVRNGEKIRTGILAGSMANDSGEISRNDRLTGRFSKRRTGFSHVIQHDTALAPNFMGGPIIDLEGRVRGLNIARANRAETYALPISLVREIYTTLRAAVSPSRHP